jgi:hypothetical protein
VDRRKVKPILGKTSSDVERWRADLEEKYGREAMNEKQLISKAMQALGSRTSKRKKKSSAANIAKGREIRAKKFLKKKLAHSNG